MVWSSMKLWTTLGKTVSLIAVTAVLKQSAEIKTSVCYNKEGIGCFSSDPPFSNTAGKLPWSPKEIGVSFLLFTRENKNIYQLLTKDEIDIRRSNFNGTKATKFIIYGLGSTVRIREKDDPDQHPWVIEMKDEILKRDDVNVIAVDWENGAIAKDYPQAAANTRVVGALTAQLIEALFKTSSVRYSDIHFIGHSLGAHIAGYVGQRVKGIGRISGLDPAGPAYEGKPPEVRLDASDANFVDVIHTDGQPLITLGFGTHSIMGHADYFVNGGKNQPGCKPAGKHILKLVTGKFRKFTTGLACDHSRARELFTESINSSCKFEAVPCNSTEDFDNGNCTCKGGMCSRMGYHSGDGTDKPSGSYYLSTNAIPPFCKA